MTDITGMASREDLRIPDTVFRRCVEDSSDAIMLTGLDGRLRYVNRSWTRLYGYSSEEALGQRAALLHSGRHDKAFYESMWADILSPAKGSWSGEVVNRARDGSLRTVLLTITPFRSAEGGAQPEGFMGLAVDQTAVKELKDALLHQDKLALLGTLASALAHEIGTPLGVIRGRAELLSGMLATGPQRQADRVGRSIGSILEQVDRVTRVMERILGFARHPAAGSNGTRHVVEARKSLQALFDDVEALVEAHFRHAGVELELATPVAGLSTTSASAIEQILMNLLLNAVRAIVQAEATSGPSSGAATTLRRVRMDIRCRPAGDEVPPGGGASLWVLAVEDSGPGVPDTLKSRVFEPFFTTDPLHGTGLGLAISSKIAHDLGGHLTLCESPQQQASAGVKPLGGARFELTLPAGVIKDQSLDSSAAVPPVGEGDSPSTNPYSRSLR